VPGKPSYLPSLSEDERKSFTNWLAERVTDSDNTSALQAIIGNQDIKYFDFTTDYVTYMQYVNLLCRMCALYLGIGDKPFNGIDGETPYKYYNWIDYKYSVTGCATQESGVDK
jgi:hypothetical protein